MVNTHFDRGAGYEDTEWWDRAFYTKGISDRQTISADKSVVSARYHYASVELLILKHLRNRRVSIAQSRVLDIGAGSGHWIEFYRSLGAAEVAALDVARSSYEYLEKRYVDAGDVEIHHGKAVDVIGRLSGEFDVVNAVGVMFHIVDDSEWAETIASVGRVVKAGGCFVVGGHFGYLDGLNVQIDRDGQINKRLRSRRHWTEQLQQAGFRDISVYKNRAYLWIRDHLPENNVLVATK